MMRISLSIIGFLLGLGLAVSHGQAQSHLELPAPVGPLQQGWDLYDAGRYDEAFKFFLPHAQQGNPEAQRAMGEMFRYGRGVPQNWPQAIGWYKKAAEGEDRSAIIALSYLYGIGLGVPQDTEIAKSYSRRAVDSGDATALNNLAYEMAISGGDLNEALILVEQALVQYPDEDAYLDTKGWILYLMGRYGDALPPLCKSARQDGGDPVVSSHLGDALYRAGHPELARTQWQFATDMLANEKLLSEDGRDIAAASIRDSLTRDLQAKLANPEAVFGANQDNPPASAPAIVPEECSPPTS